MVRKYGTYRKIQASKPRQMTGLEWQRVLAALRRDEQKPEPPGPPSAVFFLDALPRKPNTTYKILAGGIIEAGKIIMA